MTKLCCGLPFALDFSRLWGQESLHAPPWMHSHQRCWHHRILQWTHTCHPQGCQSTWNAAKWTHLVWGWHCIWVQHVMFSAPVAATLGYLAIRPSLPGPLNLFQDNSPLSRPKLVKSLCHALIAAGIDDSNFNGHSFRIGAATAAARKGLCDSLIQTLGRSKSSEKGAARSTDAACDSWPRNS